MDEMDKKEHPKVWTASKFITYLGCVLTNMLIVAAILKIGDIYCTVIHIILQKIELSGLTYWTYFWGSLCLHEIIKALTGLDFIASSINVIKERIIETH